MEYTDHSEPTPSNLERRKAIAQEIYTHITASLKHLQALPEIDEGHSSIVELKNERAIAFRALQQFDNRPMAEIVERATAA